jgi:hypothetical protein
MLQLQFSSSTAWQSSLIRRICHSPFSHVDIVLPEGLLGASGPDASLNDPGGVRIRPNPAWPYIEPPKIATLKCAPAIELAVINAARSQIGKPFDNASVHAFLGAPREDDWRETASWFCSELVIWALESESFFPYKLTVVKRSVSPPDCLLLINPFIVNTGDFLHE